MNKTGKIILLISNFLLIASQLVEMDFNNLQWEANKVSYFIIFTALTAIILISLSKENNTD